MIYISAKSLAGIQPIPVKFFSFEPAREADVPTARNLIFFIERLKARNIYFFVASSIFE